MKRKNSTRLAIAIHWLGFAAFFAYLFGYIRVELAVLVLFYGNGMGGLLAHHVRAMGWDEQ